MFLADNKTDGNKPGEAPKSKTTDESASAQDLTVTIETPETARTDPAKTAASDAHTESATSEAKIAQADVLTHAEQTQKADAHTEPAASITVLTTAEEAAAEAFEKASALRSKRLSVRSRNINALLFLATFVVMATAITAVYNSVINGILSDYAADYAQGSAEALGAHISHDLGLMSKAAHSDAVIEWLEDEENERKKSLAHKEMAEIVGELYSFNLYIGVDGSKNEYHISSSETQNAVSATKRSDGGLTDARISEENGFGAIIGGNFSPFDVLDSNVSDDQWYFSCVDSDSDFIFTVGFDHLLQRKRVWLDYKVSSGDKVLGVVSTGLEFSHIAGELFSHSGKIRCLTIGNDGMIYMDSAYTDATGKDTSNNDFGKPFADEFEDAALIDVISDQLSGNGFKDGSDAGGTEGGADAKTEAEGGGGGGTVVRIPNGSNRFAAFAPVMYADWTVVTLSGSSPMFDSAVFVPVAITLIILLIAFAVANGAVNYAVIFQPLEKLEKSLPTLRDSNDGSVYGIDRDDELGRLASTIRQLFIKANIDALTGIYNRRFMETGLERVIGVLSRSGDYLSVIMLDIDFFKRYNDTYGHDMGDTCLRSVAQALYKSVRRSGDFVARFGGEEFVFVMPSTDSEGSRVVAERLLDIVRDLNIAHSANDAAPYVTISIGVTTGDSMYARNWADYIKRADEALYVSKQNGRNQYTHLDLFQ